MEYLEIKGEFNRMLEVGDWSGINELCLELQETGNSDMEIELWEDVSEEDLADYKRWDTATNGDTETQMDDNSDNL